MFFFRDLGYFQKKREKNIGQNRTGFKKMRNIMPATN